MTEREHYEQKVMDMIRESAIWSCWSLDSRRLMGALNRLIKRGVITMEIMGYPMWRLTIAGD